MSAEAVSPMIYIDRPKGAAVAVVRHKDKTTLVLQVGKRIATLEFSLINARALAAAMVVPFEGGK